MVEVIDDGEFSDLPEDDGDADCGMYELPEDQGSSENVSSPVVEEGSFEKIVAEMDQVEDDEADRQEFDAEESPVNRLVNMVLVDALKREASSILIDCRQDDFVVRYRLDGFLYEIMRPPMRFKDAVLARIKTLAEIDLLKKKTPQRGIIAYSARRRFLAKFAVTIIPTVYGENAVLRIHRVPNSCIQEKWLLPERQEQRLREIVQKKNGLILVVGSSNEERRQLVRNIATFFSDTYLNLYSLGDRPLVFPIPGVNEILLRPEMGFGLAQAIKDIADQDLDAVFSFTVPWQKEDMVALLETALSGKLVVSSFPAESAIIAFNRLVGLGVSPLLISSAVTLVCNSRTVRRLCDKCKTQEEKPFEELMKVGFTTDQAQLPQPQKGRGCGSCLGLGYRGQLHFYEFLPISEEIRQAILQNDHSNGINLLVSMFGSPTLWQAGVEKVSQQLTTLDEVLRVI